MVSDNYFCILFLKIIKNFLCLFKIWHTANEAVMPLMQGDSVKCWVLVLKLNYYLHLKTKWIKKSYLTKKF